MISSIRHSCERMRRHAQSLNPFARGIPATDPGGGSRGRPGMAAMAGGAPAGVGVLTRQGAGSRRFGLLPSVPGSIDVSWAAVDRVRGQPAGGYEIQVTEDGTDWRRLIDDTAPGSIRF